eukprot:9265191-Pyramimonas_sp.AAC.1
MPTPPEQGRKPAGEAEGGPSGKAARAALAELGSGQEGGVQEGGVQIMTSGTCAAQRGGQG